MIRRWQSQDYHFFLAERQVTSAQRCEATYPPLRRCSLLALKSCCRFVLEEEARHVAGTADECVVRRALESVSCLRGAEHARQEFDTALQGARTVMMGRRGLKTDTRQM